jgi:hypothetical protein
MDDYTTPPDDITSLVGKHPLQVDAQEQPAKLSVSTEAPQAESNPAVSSTVDSRQDCTHNRHVSPGHLATSNGQTNGTITPLASRNGHVNFVDRAQSEPYAINFALTGTLAEDHRAILKNESGLSDEAIAARRYWTCDGDKLTLRYLGLATNIGRCLVIPLFNYRGEQVGHVARPDIPIPERTGKTRKYLLPKGAAQVADVSPLTRQYIDDPHALMIVTEGAKKADSAASRGLFAFNLNGVFGFRGTNEKDGITNLATWDQIDWEGKNDKGEKFGRVILVCFDSDVTTNPRVGNALRRFCALAASRGAIVKIVQFEPGPNGEKTGLDDFFARDGGTIEKLLAMARDLESVSESRRKAKEKKNQVELEKLRASGLPVIETNNRQLSDELADLASAFALANQDAPQLFHGAAGLVAVSKDKDGCSIFESITREALQARAAMNAKWISTSEREGIRNVAPPRDLCAGYLASSHLWQNISPIDSIMTAPIFDANGTLCATSGYHPKARIWLALPEGFTLPDTTPTAANVKRAKQLILETLLGEVAFADQASLAHAVSLMILPFVRSLINGQTPNHLFDAPTQSSGKSYAAKVCIAPFAKPTPMSDKGEEEEEWRKSLIAALLSGRSHIFLDNAKGRLSSPALATAITEDTLTERALGGLNEVTVSTRRVYVTTSNNARLDKDTVSRSVMIRIDTQMERPESRMYCSDPLQYIANNRAQVIGAVVTLVNHWLVTGCPLFTGGGSRFSQWSQVMGGIVHAADIPGFLFNVNQSLDGLDPEVEAWREFVSAWWKEHQGNYVTAAQLLPLAMKCEELAATVGDAHNQAARLGRMLLNRRDKIFNGKMATFAGIKPLNPRQR